LTAAVIAIIAFLRRCGHSNTPWPPIGGITNSWKSPEKSADGARGGNVGLLGGSVAWKDIRQMRTYRGSQLWDEAGSFGMW
jgi:hypothetical protein